jgi:hypothetical protein
MPPVAMKKLTTGMLLCCLACGLACADPSLRRDDPVADEDLLKAAFIYNFAKFTRWPEWALGAAERPFTLCTAGSDELVAALDRLADQTMRGRPVRVARYEAARTDGQCQVLYIGASEHHHYWRLLEQVHGTPILTVSEIRGFADAGGIIQLYHARDRIRFKINLDTARSSGLRLSARLLDLAEVIGNGEAP